jgi:CheY-like chemotaxis protein
LGEGTTAELWLPATDEAADHEAVPHLEPLAASHAAKVLLVDDEEIVRHAIAEMLRDIGYNVEEAESAAQALAVLRSGTKTELLVTDYLMPGMTGAALIAELRAAGYRMPVLLITGYTPAGGEVPPDVPRLSKPFRQVDLAAKVDELLRVSAGHGGVRT